MAKAKTMTQKMLSAFLEWVEENDNDPEVMLPVFMLSFYAGLRVQEIAGLQWDVHVFNSPGTFHSREFPVYENGHPLFNRDGSMIVEAQHCIEIVDDISKYTGERTIPLHPALEQPLLHLWELERSDWVVPAGTQSRPVSHKLGLRAHALRVRMKRVYDRCPFTDGGFSSHSGRRAFGTRSGQRANVDNCSLRDTQALLGHASIRTTQHYLDVSPNQAKHVGRIWDD